MTDFDFIIPPVVFDEEESDARRAAAVAWTKEQLMPASEMWKLSMKGHRIEPRRINLISLPAWLKIAELAEIQYIPATQIAKLDSASYLEALDDPAHSTKIDAFEDEIVRKIGAGEMIRFEQVAPAEIKANLSEGQEMGNGSLWSEPLQRMLVSCYDDRFVSTFLDLGEDEIRAFARPIVEPLKVSNDQGEFPVEFRVFVEDFKIVGISNYYPQVALDPVEHRGQASKSLLMAQAMIETMKTFQIGVGNHWLNPGPRTAPSHLDWIPDGWGDQSFTLDFLSRADTGEMVFLEGGPAGGIGQPAHPCCFEGYISSGQAIFAEGGPMIPMEELQAF